MPNITVRNITELIYAGDFAMDIGVWDNAWISLYSGPAEGPVPDNLLGKRVVSISVSDNMLNVEVED